MPTSATARSITAFWRWLADRPEHLAALVHPQQPFWDEVLGRLQRIDDGLFFELSEPDGLARELVLTARGDSRLFPLVEAVAAQAPRLPGWTVIALKPAQGFDFSTDFEGLRLEPRRMWFLPLTHREAPAALGLRVAVPDLDPKQAADARSGVWVVLDTALGEREAEAIQHLELCPVPAAPEQAGFIELPELARYLDHHRRRHPRS